MKIVFNSILILAVLSAIGGTAWYWLESKGVTPFQIFSSGKVLELNDTVAIINEEIITAEKFNKHLDLFLNLNPDFKEIEDNVRKIIQNVVLENLIDETLLNQRATELGIEIEEDEMQEFVANVVNPFGENETKVLMRDYNVSLNEWLEVAGMGLKIQKVVETELPERIRITQAEIEEELSKVIVDLKKKRYDISQILVGDAELASLIRKDLANGSDFVDYVETYSISPDKIDEGKMGTITQGTLPRELDDIAFALKKEGELSPVAKSNLGYHIFKLNRILDSNDFTDIRERITVNLRTRKLTLAYNEWIKELRNRASIEVKLISL